MRAITLIWIVFLTACTPRAVREAESVVAQADSLRAEGRVYGIDEGDSATLAQAYETLSIFNSPLLSTLNPQLSTVFSHSCYHYGRLLREKDNPVEAMQVFINATHSRTRDYHILGRVYSNMGSICHLAGDYPLSYEMFKCASDMFIGDRDSLNYYYTLNEMAFEKAMLLDHKAVDSLTNHIWSACSDYNLLASTYETKAELYLQCQQYDSALNYASQSCKTRKDYSLGILICAQVYSLCGQKDSAVYYANQVLLNSPYLLDKNNALYILTNDDEDKDISSVRETAANRSDVQKLLEIQQGKMSQAVQLLEQDLNRKPNLAWLYAIIATLVIGGAIATMYISHKRKKHQLLSQQIDDLEHKNKVTIEQKKQQIVERCSILVNSPNLKEDLCWNDYDKMCHVVNHHFGLLARKLQQTYHLSEREIRLCVLSLLNLGYDTMAEMLFYSPNGIGKFKLRVAQKLGTTAKNLQQFLITKAIDN